MKKSILFKYLGIVFSLLTSALWIGEFGRIYYFEFISLDDVILFTSFISLVLFILSHNFKKKEGLSSPLASLSADNIPILDYMENTGIVISLLYTVGLYCYRILSPSLGESDWEGFIIFLSFTSSSLFISSYIFKKKEGLSDPLVSQSVDNNSIIDTMASNNSQAIIPDTCPHCKNPNTKRIRLCEWCGNQIA